MARIFVPLLPSRDASHRKAEAVMEPSSLIRLEDASYRKTEVKHRASTLESGTSSFIFMGLKCKFAWITHDFCIFPDKSLVVKKVLVTL